MSHLRHGGGEADFDPSEEDLNKVDQQTEEPSNMRVVESYCT